MVIECSSCNARFKLADDKIKEGGTKVRCTKCRDVFTVYPEIPPEIIPEVEVPPVITNKKSTFEDSSFSVEEKASLETETSPPFNDLPVTEEDNWNQKTDLPLISDEFSARSSTSDLDSFNFDSDDWGEGAVASDVSNEFTAETGTSDLDTINFDNNDWGTGVTTAVDSDESLAGSGSSDIDTINFDSDDWGEGAVASDDTNEFTAETGASDLDTINFDNDDWGTGVTAAVDSDEFPPGSDSSDLDAINFDNDEWNSGTVTSVDPNGFPLDIGTSDPDTINFDNIETPIFSATNENDNNFDFVDDTAFSFEDSSFTSETDQQYKISEATDAKTFPLECGNDFEADFSLDGPPISPSNALSPKNPVTIDGEFTFSSTENTDDFPWEEENTTQSQTIPLEKTPEPQPSPQDSAFDFSSFSFDEASSPVDEEKDDLNESELQSEKKLELSLETESLPTPILTNIPPKKEESQKSPPHPSIATDQHETPPSSRPLKPRIRSRRKKKVSSRLAVKILFGIFLSLTSIYGIINREQLKSDYKNFINIFIENQVRVETNGQIKIINLTGDYLTNNQNEVFFVVRGEAINEFKELRSSVLVRGNIYGEKGAIIQSQSAYCGNPLRDKKLKQSGFKEIRDAMNNELGENLININIAPGKSVPCTIVFNKAPKNIKEFTVEVLESKTGSK